MRLDVESLRALRSVVQTGTFTEAATELGMSQSAVSWKIKRLEERVGAALVKRGQDIEATPDGDDLLGYAERIIDAHDEAVVHLSRSDLRGVVRLGTNEDLQARALADVLARFARMYPQIRLDVRVGLSGSIKEWLDDGEVDLALLQIPVDEIQPDDVVLWTEQLQWVHTEGHKFPTNATVPVVSFGPGLAYLAIADESLKRAGLPWRTVLECPMLSGVQAAVESGLGVAALNDRNITGEMIEWAEGPTDLPELSQVVRAGVGADPEVLGALRSTLIDALSAGGRAT